MEKKDKNNKVQNGEYYLNLEEQDKVYRYIYGIGDQYLKLLKEKNITSLSELKESITNLRDKNYKTTRALKDTEKKID